MFALARELASSGSNVVTTTTTMIFPPLSGRTQFLIVEPDEGELIKSLSKNIGRYRHITIATEKLASGKLKGVSPDLVNRLIHLKLISYVIVEADGAARKSLKAPNATEPVIPESTSLVIPVVGVDVIDRSLSSENVFRAEIASVLLGLSLGTPISAESIAVLVTHLQGLTKGKPLDTRIIPFINKVEMEQDLSKARDIALEILHKRHRQIERVVLGQAQSLKPVVEVILKYN
jgi:probable selenium-dependent hydroxylase accessory protein YqeC